MRCELFLGDKGGDLASLKLLLVLEYLTSTRLYVARKIAILFAHLEPVFRFTDQSQLRRPF